MRPLHSLTGIGEGGWATALVKIFYENRINFKRNQKSRKYVTFLMTNGRNPYYLSFLQLNQKYIQQSCISGGALSSSSDALFAVPIAFPESTIGEFNEEIVRDKRKNISIKGLMPDRYQAKENTLVKQSNLAVPVINVVQENKIAKALSLSFVNNNTIGYAFGCVFAAFMKKILGIESRYFISGHFGRFPVICFSTFGSNRNFKCRISR